MKKTTTNKVPQGKQLKELRKQVDLLRKKFQMFNMQIIEHQKQFDERTMTYWEYLWSIVEGLRQDAQFDWLTDQRIDELRNVVIDRWKKEALEHIKEDLEPGSAVCEACHFLSGGPNFFKDGSDKPVCPNCKAEDSMYLKDTEVD